MACTDKRRPETTQEKVLEWNDSSELARGRPMGGSLQQSDRGCAGPRCFDSTINGTLPATNDHNALILCNTCVNKLITMNNIAREYLPTGCGGSVFVASGEESC
jgi:hypothetical protein